MSKSTRQQMREAPDGQPSLFDAVLAQQAAVEAISRAEKHADPAWKQETLAAILTVAHRLPLFTSDDVWLELADNPESSTHEPRALGALVKRVARMGHIVATSEYRPSIRPACHARPVRVWKSLVYDTQGM